MLGLHAVTFQILSALNRTYQLLLLFQKKRVFHFKRQNIRIPYMEESSKGYDLLQQYYCGLVCTLLLVLHMDKRH